MVNKIFNQMITKLLFLSPDVRTKPLLLIAGASGCCAGTIEDNGITCGEPPCIPDPAFFDPLPPGSPVDSYTMCHSLLGGIISPDESVCCSQSCGTCGGEGYDARSGGKAAGYECAVCLVTLI